MQTLRRHVHEPRTDCISVFLTTEVKSLGLIAQRCFLFVSDVDWHMFESMLQAVGEGEGPSACSCMVANDNEEIVCERNIHPNSGKARNPGRGQLESFKITHF